MATYYLDYEGGNDANAGTSFALRWKTLTSGATAARIAPGDTVRVMGSPDPTSLGVNGTWTDCPNYGNAVTINISSSTNASPIAVTTATHGLSTGDYVLIASHTTNTKANGLWKVTVTSSTVFTLDGSTGNGVGGATGTFQKMTNAVVELASAVTKTVASTGNIGSGRTAWTASANVTCTLGTTNLLKSGDVNDTFQVAAGFTTGKAAYKALGAVTDFSAYNQISFMIHQVAGTIPAAGALSIKLCSDTAGATAVNTFNLPAFGPAGNSMKVTIDNGSALGSSIQSVAFYVNTDSGAQTFFIDNIIACKDPTAADSLTLTSLIGKNTGNETWYGIAAINDTMVLLDGAPTSTQTQMAGYTGTTETVTTYKREPIKVAFATATTTNNIGAIQDSGTDGNLIAFEGGWDRTAMTTQNTETWFSGQTGEGIGIQATSKNYFSINKISLVQFSNNFLFTTCTYTSLDNVHSNNSKTTGISYVTSSTNNSIGTIYGLNNGAGTGLSVDVTSNNLYVNNIYAANNSVYGSGIVINSAGCVINSITSASNNSNNIQLLGENNIIYSITDAKNSKDTTSYGSLRVEGNNNTIYNAGTVTNNRFAGITISGDARVYNATTSGSTSSGVKLRGNGMLRNCSIGEATEFSVFSTTYNGSFVYSEKHDQTADNHYIWTTNGIIQSNTTTRHTASGISWKMSPTVNNYNGAIPLRISIAKIACTANNLVTVKAWMQRDSTSLTMSLFCPGGQLAGVASNVTSSMTAAINTWEELTITFTPTEAGVIEIFALASGGTTLNGYVDDMTITQA